MREVKVGSLDFVKGQRVLLGRDEGGLYAMSAVCTHYACDMATDGHVGAAGVECDCHGSKYDKNGRVTAGPAGKDLEHYKVEVAPNGEITIQAGTPVDPSSRTPVSG